MATRLNMNITPIPTIQTLAPYVLADLSGPKDKTLISLAQNELCFSPSEQVIEAANKAINNAQLYPDPDWVELTAAIAGVHDLNAKQILCGVGSMELLELLGRVYLSSDDRVLMSQYGYSFFKTVAQMYGTAVDMAREVNFTVNIDSILELVKPNTKFVFLANPGNPTGTLLAAQEILRLRNELPKNILLVVDEAYAEFTDPDTYPALFDLVGHGNTVVLRTFSKIYGLAGMRVGWGYFPSEVYSAMRKAMNPNNISAPSQAAATMAMRQQYIVEQRKAIIDSIRTKFVFELKQLGLDVPQSHSNFVLIDFTTKDRAQFCFEQLRAQGIIMRPMGAYGLTHCLRATLSHQDHMNATIEHLTRILEEYGS